MSIFRVFGMEMLLHILLVLELSWIANSFNVYEPARTPGWNYFGYSWTEPKPSVVFRKPMAAMVDLTNDLGVAILQDYSYSRSNFAFSPYGVASVLVVLYEGTRGESARQIHRAVRFPWDRDITRIGFRDIHRHLRSYFSHEGYLSGITLSKEGSSLKPEYKRILRFYGYDVDVDSPEKTTDPPLPSTTKKVTSTSIAPTSTAASSVTHQNDAHTDGMTGNDVTTIREVDTEETNVATTTIKPALSEDEVITALSTMLDREFPTSTVGMTVEVQEEENMLTTEKGEENKPNTEIGQEEAVTTERGQEQTEDIKEQSEVTDGQQQMTTEELQEGKQTTDPQFQTAIVEKGSTESSEITILQESSTFTTIAPEMITTESGVPFSSRIPETSIITEGATTAWESSINIETTSTNEEVEDITSTAQTGVTEELASLKLKQSGNTTPEEDDRFSKNGAIDNGMLIPQESRNVEIKSRFINSLSERNADKNLKLISSPSAWQERGTDLETEGDQLSWKPKTIEEFLLKLMNSTRNSTRDKRLVSGKYRKRRMNSTNFYTKESSFSKKNRWMRQESISKNIPVDFETSARMSRRHLVKKKRTVSDFSRIPPVTDLSLQLQNGMFDSHVSKDTDLYRVLPKFLFLVDGAIDTPVPMMTYTNVFPYAYIPRLHSKALEFPLDDERYKLLILLPVERRGLRQLIYDLTSYSLRDVIDVLRPTRVKTMVPTFMVEGFVILTPTLQKLGIWDVFDPRRSDLSGMTTDPDLYVRNIEQSVTVVIRNYVEILDIQTRTMAARNIDEDFTVSHPFLYFVMDTTTNVALMAGQMLDPLNSRIY